MKWSYFKKIDITIYFYGNLTIAYLKPFLFKWMLGLRMMIYHHFITDRQ